MAGRDFSAELFGPSAGRDFSAELFGANLPEKQSAFRQIADVPLGIAKGAVQGVRMIADAFGAGSDTSNTIKSAETYLADLMSAQAKNDQQEISRIMKDAEDKGVLDQVKAGIKAFTVAPVDTLSSALGTAAPVIAGALGAKILGAGALVSTGVSALTGAGMGAGVVKGSIYEETKRTLKEAGASEQDAEARAKLAQEYGGKNLDQILLGTVLGGAAAVGPLEKGAAGILARRILGKTEGTEAVAGQAAKGALRRRAEAGLLEAVPEAVQAGQEQVAQNIALQREGFDVPTFRGAVSSATLEAIAGGGLGATLGGGKPTPEAPAPEAPPVAPPPVAPEVGLEQLTPQQKQELERQRALTQRPKTTEELLAETAIQTGRPTTAQDIARIRDEHETAVIEGLLAQDAEMARANELAAQQREQQRQQTQLESEAEAISGGISDVDRRVREGRIFARVQDLIDRNIPYASTAINDINQKFGVINEAPLTEDERARVENIMGMVNTFTNFVNLPVLSPKPVDQFAENQAMEALIKERTERGQAQPLRTTPVAPSPSVQEAPVSQGVGEGAAVRPTGGVEPSAPQDRQLITAPVTPPAPPVEPAPVVEAAATAAPAEEPSRSSEAWRNEGKTPEVLIAEKVEAVGSELASQIAEEASAKDFAPNDLPAAIQQWATDSKVPADDLRASVIKALDKFDISEARKAQVRKALSPLRAAAPKAEAPAVEAPAPPPAPESNQQALEEKRQMVADMIETKKANREAVPEAWIKKLADLSAQLRGETISEGETYSMEVAGHPLFDGSPVLRNLIPIKVKDSDAAQRALDRALDLEKQFATEFYGAKQALKSARTAAEKKAAQTRIKKLNDQGWDEDALQTLRNETIQELSRLVDVTQKAAPKAEAPTAEPPPTLDTTGIKEVKGRHIQVQAAAKLLQDKKMTREEFEKYVDYYKPIQEVEADKLLPPTTEQKMNETVNADKRDRINVPVEDGTKVGLRMDLPARDRGGSVVSIQQGNSGKLTVGKLISFRSTGWLKNVTFEVRSQEKGLAVATGGTKAPLQTAEGTWFNLSPEETYARVKELMKDPAWKQVSFDPSRHGYFYDRKTREPVVSASEMYQVGQFLLAKDVKYAPKTDFLYSLGGAKAQQSNFEQTLRNLLNKFGLKDVGLSIIEGMQDAGSYAQQLIRIADRADNPIRTLRHEAIHALRELGFFTDAQWKSLSKMAKDKWIDQYLKQRNVDGKPLKAGEESRYDAYMREYNGDMEKITEEAVADAFADFDASKPPAGLLQALLKRMNDLFQSIKSALTKVESVDQIFGKVEEGKLKPGEKAEAGERKSVRDRATANFLRWFGDSKAVNEKGEPLVVYHGSKSDITEFDPSKGAAGNQGMFFTTDIDLANVYGKDGAVYPVYVSIKNPLILQGNERFAPQGIKGKLAKLLFPAQYTKAEREQRIKDMLFDGNAGRIFSKQDVELLRREGYDGVVTMNAYPEGSNLQVIVAFEPTQIKSAIGNNGDYSLTNPDIRKSIGGVSPGQKALETIRSMGMDVPKPDETKLEKAQAIWKKAKEDPKLTAQSALKAARDFMDKVETWAFSPDAKLNNDFRRAVIKDFKENEGVLGQLLEMSQSQAVHADALSSQFLIDGGLKYNDKVQKWESFESKANFPALSKKLDEIGEKYGLNKEQIERVAHAYLVAKRLPGLIERNKNLDAEIAAEQASIKPDKKKIKDLEDKKVFISEKQLEQIEPGLSLVKDIPELNQVVDMWNEIRKNTIDVMVNSGLWSTEYAQQMWDNMDYVPYFRDDQIENEAGPQEFIRGLQVKSKEFQLKGSEDAVHDVFDNMIRWTQYAINRSVRAHKALQMIDNARDIQIGDRKMAEKVTEEKRGMNIARVFRDGKQELYDMADPMYVQAFSAIQNVSIPTIKFMAQVSNVLRQSVVLYPLFSVAQVPQDAFAAMFTSGLKTQHALKIPYLAVKEFIKTLNKTSATHNTLKKFGATGVRDFSATVIRDDAEIYAGLKPPRGGWGKTKEVLSHISMAADNAVRQAVYEASMQQGVKQSEAIEKAFDVINFRRKGTSKMLNILGQTVPFFYAYLSAQRVALKVLTGTGISPTDRKEAFQTLATTSAAVATLSLLYAMANGDDEDYMETPANIRDRTLTIPGSGGVRIPLRPDFFLFPKIIAEHTYLMLSDQGYQDGAKFRKSMADALLSAVASPTPFPTAIKPAIEVAINYDFFQGKPLIGNFEKQKDIERQFRDSTSELAKILSNVPLSYSLEKGKFEGLSPIAIDHMIRGMFGSFGGLLLFGTNQFLHSDPDVPRPELSAGEMLTALPGTSGLLKRPQESALKNDFYTLRDEVEKAVNTFNDIKTRSPQGMEDFLADEKQMARLMLGKPVDQISQRLSKIRRQITIITNMPENQMSAEDKSDNIRQLREFEREYLKSVDVKALREMAKI